MEGNSEDNSATTSETNEGQGTENEAEEPTPKKLCLKRSYASEYESDAGECSVTAITTTLKLEKRLSTVLCCTVCLDLPVSTIFQVVFRFHWKFFF